MRVRCKKNVGKGALDGRWGRERVCGRAGVAGMLTNAAGMRVKVPEEYESGNIM